MDRKLTAHKICGIISAKGFHDKTINDIGVSVSVALEIIDLVLADAAHAEHPGSDKDFRAWVETLPDESWAKKDLSACKLGWDAAMQHVRDIIGDDIALYERLAPCDHAPVINSTELRCRRCGKLLKWSEDLETLEAISDD